MQHIRPAIVLLVLMTLITGFFYPLAITGLAQTVFPQQAKGSLLRAEDKVVGSQLIGQTFTSARYFHGRPSAAGNGYDAANSSGSNLAPGSKKLKDRIATDVAALRAQNPGVPVPDDLVTASASGLDPDISPANAELQVARVAKARGLGADRVRQAVSDNTSGRFLGMIGEPRVNVLQLNLALDTLK